MMPRERFRNVEGEEEEERKIKGRLFSNEWLDALVEKEEEEEEEAPSSTHHLHLRPSHMWVRPHIRRRRRMNNQPSSSSSDRSLSLSLSLAHRITKKEKDCFVKR